MNITPLTRHYVFSERTYVPYVPNPGYSSSSLSPVIVVVVAAEIKGETITIIMILSFHNVLSLSISNYKKVSDLGTLGTQVRKMMHNRRSEGY